MSEAWELVVNICREWPRRASLANNSRCIAEPLGWYLWESIELLVDRETPDELVVTLLSRLREPVALSWKLLSTVVKCLIEGTPELVRLSPVGDAVRIAAEEDVVMMRLGCISDVLAVRLAEMANVVMYLPEGTPPLVQPIGEVLVVSVTVEIVGRSDLSRRGIVVEVVRETLEAVVFSLRTMRDVLVVSEALAATG